MNNIYCALTLVVLLLHGSRKAQFTDMSACSISDNSKIEPRSISHWCNIDNVDHHMMHTANSMHN